MIAKNVAIPKESNDMIVLWTIITSSIFLAAAASIYLYYDVFARGIFSYETIVNIKLVFQIAVFAILYMIIGAACDENPYRPIICAAVVGFIVVQFVFTYTANPLVIKSAAIEYGIQLGAFLFSFYLLGPMKKQKNKIYEAQWVRDNP